MIDQLEKQLKKTNALSLFHKFFESIQVIRVVSTWVSKPIYVYFGFALLRSVIGLKISRHFLSQSEVKPKPIMSRWHASSRASFDVFASRFDWFKLCEVFVIVIGQGVCGDWPKSLWLAKVITLVT